MCGFGLCWSRTMFHLFCLFSIDFHSVFWFLCCYIVFCWLQFVSSDFYRWSSFCTGFCKLFYLILSDGSRRSSLVSVRFCWFLFLSAVFYLYKKIEGTENSTQLRIRSAHTPPNLSPPVSGASVCGFGPCWSRTVFQLFCLFSIDFHSICWFLE